MNKLTISDMIGKTFVSIDGCESDNEMVFKSSDGFTFKFYHCRECGESVSIESVDGDISDLLDAPMLMAEEVSSEDYPKPRDVDVYQWTFYKFATKKGYVTVRWLGDSNGYYSLDVDFQAWGGPK